MRTEQIEKVLQSETGVKKTGAGYEIGDELELSVILAVGNEALTVQRVRKISVSAELLVIETHKGERVYLGGQDEVRALKFGAVDAQKLRGAGFTALR